MDSGVDPAVVAGVVATAIFAASTLPMMLRAARTRDLSSYSRSNLVLVNVGNLVQTAYVLSLPLGPVWFLHAFYTVTSVQMLLWHLRFAGSPGAPSATGLTVDGGGQRRGSAHATGLEPPCERVL